MNFLELINGLDDELIEESAEYEIKKDITKQALEELLIFLKEVL